MGSGEPLLYARRRMDWALQPGDVPFEGESGAPSSADSHGLMHF